MTLLDMLQYYLEQNNCIVIDQMKITRIIN